MFIKLLLLSIISIIISASVMTDNHLQKVITHSEKTENNLVPVADQQQSSSPIGIDLSDFPNQQTASHSHNQPNNDDDGKSHHFHFDHVSHKRRTIFFLFVGKLVLLASFLSSLISAFYIWHF